MQSDRLWRFFTRASALVFAIVLGVIAAALVGGFVAWQLLENEFPEADAAKARVEVHRYYEARFPGRVQVGDCDYVEMDSVFDTFACTVRVECERRLIFTVPRAGAIFRSDSDPHPEMRGNKPRCSV